MVRFWVPPQILPATLCVAPSRSMFQSPEESKKLRMQVGKDPRAIMRLVSELFAGLLGASLLGFWDCFVFVG